MSLKEKTLYLVNCDRLLHRNTLSRYRPDIIPLGELVCVKFFVHSNDFKHKADPKEIDLHLRREGHRVEYMQSEHYIDDTLVEYHRLLLNAPFPNLKVYCDNTVVIDFNDLIKTNTYEFMQFWRQGRSGKWHYDILYKPVIREVDAIDVFARCYIGVQRNIRVCVDIQRAHKKGA